jgi:glycosyltransferase involved in cell wall biosynthesis
MSGQRRLLVLMVHDYPPLTGGGLALGVREITAALHDEFEFRILSSRSHDHFADDRERLTSTSTSHESVGTLVTPRQALRWLRKADVVMVHWTFSFRRLSTLLLLLAPLLRKPTVLVVQTAPDHCVYNRMRHLPAGLRHWLVSLVCAAARRCSLVVALSHTQAAALADAGFPVPRVVALPVATDPYGRAWRAREGEPMRTIMILGELSELKGADAIPALLPVLASQFSVRIVGKGPLARTVALAVAALPPSSRANVAISDPVDPVKVPRLYEEADYLLVLSRTESQSRVTLEAMLSGVVVLARPVGGVRDLITNNANGFLIDPDDPVSVRELLVRLSNDLVEVDHIRLRARTVAARAYDRSRIEWRRVLLDVTSDPLPPAAAPLPSSPSAFSGSRRQRMLGP